MYNKQIYDSEMMHTYALHGCLSAMSGTLFS